MNHILQNIFHMHGTEVRVRADRPLPAVSEMRLYVVVNGRADFYTVPLVSGVISGAKRFFCSFNPGEVFLICPRSEKQSIDFTASTIGATSLLEMDPQVFWERSLETDVLEMATGLFDSFVSKILAALPVVEYPKQLQVDLSEKTSTSQHLGQGENCSCHTGIMWIEVKSGSLFLRHDHHIILPAREMFPVTPATWATAIEDTELSVTTTTVILAENKLMPALQNFIAVMLAMISAAEQARHGNDLKLLQQKTALDDAGLQESLDRFSLLLHPEQKSETIRSSTPLLAVFTLVSRQLDIFFDAARYTESAHDNSCDDQLQRIASLAGVRTRKVTLEEGWWNKDCGHLIAFTKEAAQPVALICQSGGGYTASNTATGEVAQVNSGNAEQLRYFAYMLYRSFPDNDITFKSLVTFGIQGIKRDLAMVIVMGLCGSILGLASPIVTGIVFDSVIPQAQRSQMWLLSLALIFCSIGSLVFGLTKHIAMLRIESRMDLHVQGAVWDRLLKLPPPFFRKFSSGDLAIRSMGISAIRRTFTGTITESVLSAVFSVSSLALLFYYSFHLALIAIAIAAFAIVIMMALGFTQLHYQKLMASQSGALSGKVLEIITCIAKFRIAGAENRAFSRWAEVFFSQHEYMMKSRNIANTGTVFSEIFPVLETMVIFGAVIGLSSSNPMSIGSFMAFSAAFSQFIAALMSLSTCVVSISSIIPIYERSKAIMESPPERSSAKEYPGRLKGNLEVSGVSFAYDASLPSVLSDIRFRVLPGEFVAIVGTSGSGKSTLARLLLGFERPGTGCIFYDGKDLERLDVQQVRRQIGVVLQNGKMISGDILSNIVGTLNLSIEHAWEAARMAGLEEDIKNMPMGMHTFISEGGGNLSGGQRQRLLIARALIGKPAILLFDEATSALDNRTQAIVNEGLESLRVTRIVIAHRLSTIINADRIYVLDKGKIVESGRYDELMELNGLFANLAKHQVV